VKEEAGEFLLQPKKISVDVEGTYFFFFAVFFAVFLAAFLVAFAIKNSPPFYPEFTY
jgi:hypothetical protein